MSTIKGKWVWNDKVTVSSTITQSVSFISNGESFASIVFKSGSKGHILYDTKTIFQYDGAQYTLQAPEYTIMDFGDTEQTVSDDWYAIFIANATQQADPVPATPYVTIVYDGSTIASLESNKKATLDCAGHKMADNIFIDFPVMSKDPAEEWDFSYTVSDSVTLISFTIEGTTYQAEEGMTWEQWVASDYNTAGYSKGTVDGSILAPSSSYYVDDGLGKFSIATRVIVAGNEYTHSSNHSGGGVQ